MTGQRKQLRTGFLLFCFVWVMLDYQAKGQERDRGANNPILKLNDKFSDALSRAEKAIPRGQKYQILNSLRHRLKANPKDKNNPVQLLKLAFEFKRFRFYEEAMQLFAEVADNSSLDDSSLLQAHRALGELNFVANDDVEKAIEHFNAALKFAPKKSRVRGDLLGRLGSYYFVNDQVDEMIRIYREFNRLPERVKDSLPDSHLKANLYPARFSKDPKQAAQFYKQSQQIIADHPDSFPLELVLSVSFESSKSQTWNSTERVKRLEKLLENKRYAQSPQIRQIAMEVFLAYALESGNNWSRFEKATKATMNLLDEYKPKAKKDVDSISLGCQVLAIFVGCAKQHGRDWNKARYREDYADRLTRVKTMKIYLPSGATKSDREDIVEMFSIGNQLLKPADDKHNQADKYKQNRKPKQKDPKDQPRRRSESKRQAN